MRRWMVLLAGLAAAAALVAPRAAASPERFIVHEWGTFTSVSGQAGVQLDWRPLDGKTTDLPGFVYTLASGERGTRFPPGSVPRGKGGIEGRVRMETPVVYFYSGHDRKVSLSVRFPGGTITEWYPRARSVAGDAIDWGTFTVLGDTSGKTPPRLLVEKAPSHYYPAREVDSSPLRVGSSAGNEYEKFLFYRGVGSFELPLSARVDKSGVILRAAAGASVGTVILYERHGDKLGWRRAELGAGAEAILERPVVGSGSRFKLVAELAVLLARQGLTPHEVNAMLATWRDSWFEDGLRVFYVLPTAATAAALPMTIDPRPDELVRVLVGRVELITPEVEKAALDTLEAVDPACPDSIASARATLEARHGRFARAVLAELLRETHDRGQEQRIAAVLASSETEAEPEE